MKAFLTVAVILFQAYLMAEVRVFLQPKYYVNEKELKLSDIANISGPDDESGCAKATVIPVDLYRDSFIDRNEIETLLLASGLSAKVFGSAVRLLPKSSAPKNGQAQDVMKGDIVDVIVKRGSVTITLRGESLVNADEGETVSVWVNGKKRMRGILEQNKTVMVGI
jgi:hypothetical protein